MQLAFDWSTLITPIATAGASIYKQRSEAKTNLTLLKAQVAAQQAAEQRAAALASRQAHYGPLQPSRYVPDVRALPFYPQPATGRPEAPAGMFGIPLPALLGVGALAAFFLLRRR